MSEYFAKPSVGVATRYAATRYAATEGRLKAFSQLTCHAEAVSDRATISVASSHEYRIPQWTATTRLTRLRFAVSQRR